MSEPARRGQPPSPASVPDARKQALLAAAAPERPGAPAAGTDPEAERKRALLAAAPARGAPDESARKAALLRPADAEPTPPRQPEPTRTGRLGGAVAARLRTYPRRRLAAAVALVVVAAATATYGLTRPPAPVPLTRSDVDQAVAKGIEAERKSQAAAPPRGETVYAAIRPSVVVVTVDSDGDGVDDGSGAGTIVKDDGTVLTALHVVVGARRVSVRFADQSTSAASLANVDAAHDIAVLTVNQPPALVIPAVIGGGVRVGDPVYTLGHPFGLTGSLSAGIVSATGRTLTPKGSAQLKDMIQIDAAVNPGNSGGPLLNRNGEVVGVVSSLANPSDNPYFIGIGFAAPITSAGGAAGAPPQ